MREAKSAPFGEKRTFPESFRAQIETDGVRAPRKSVCNRGAPKTYALSGLHEILHGDPHGTGNPSKIDLILSKDKTNLAAANSL